MKRTTMLLPALLALAMAETAAGPSPAPAVAGTSPQPQPVSGDASSTCAYVTVSQGEVPESRDIFDAMITRIDGDSTPLGRRNRYRVEPGAHVLTIADRIAPKRLPAAANAQISKMKDLEQQRAYKQVQLDVQPGLSYAIGAKLLRDRLDVQSIRDNAYWEPIVWDIRPEPCG